MTRFIRELYQSPTRQKGAIGYILAWALGIPIPILIIIALVRGCA